VSRRPGRRAAHVYGGFGLRIGATHPVPGLAPLAGVVVPDVFVHLHGTPWLERDRAAPDAGEAVYASADHDEDGRPLLTVERLGRGRSFRFRYADGIEFVLDAGGREIRATWPAPWTIDDVATYLLGPVFAFALRLRGVTCLHASAVAIADRAIAFIGPAGAGKSTVAAAFARRGCPGISDDVAALGWDGDAAVVHPGPARIRLWPESVLALYGSTDALPRLTPTWDKRFVDLTANGYRLHDRALPLVAIYVLDERESSDRVPRLEHLSPAAALMALVANTQANHLLDTGMRALEFQSLGRLVASVGVRRIVPHEDVARLPALCDLVVDDVAHSAAHV
jgi:hypothetical protein